jgi:hypothetical protein
MNRIMSFIHGYFSKNGNKVFLLAPIAYGKKLNSRSERKKFSINKVQEFISISKNKFIPNKFLYKYHDVCDAVTLGVFFITENLNIKKMEIEEIKIEINVI